MSDKPMVCRYCGYGHREENSEGFVTIHGDCFDNLVSTMEYYEREMQRLRNALIKFQSAADSVKTLYKSTFGKPGKAVAVSKTGVADLPSKS